MKDLIRMQQLAGLITENQAEEMLNEGELLKIIKPSGEFKTAVIDLENYLSNYLPTDGDFDYNELASLIINIKDAGASEGY
jgi:hypothetical protein